MLRRNLARLKHAEASVGASAAAGLGDQPVFRVSSLFRPVDAKPVTADELAAEGVRTGRDVAAASVIDFVELQWMLLPYRVRKLGLEVVEARRIGLKASLPSENSELARNVLVMVLFYMLCFRVGRNSWCELVYPREPAAEAKSSEKK